jgi:hypothetical protein
MEFQRDFADLCALLNANAVEFLIVGGYAVAFHGAPRFTGDLDILVNPGEENVSRLLEALSQFGFPASDLSPANLVEERKILQLGHVPIQIHIMTNISGVSWQEAWESRRDDFYGEVPVSYIGLQALIQNKRCAGRTKDFADIEALQRKSIG